MTIPDVDRPLYCVRDGADDDVGSEDIYSHCGVELRGEAWSRWTRSRRSVWHAEEVPDDGRLCELCAEVLGVGHPVSHGLAELASVDERI